MSAPNKLVLVNQFGEESINTVEGHGVPLVGTTDIILINGPGAPVNGTTGMGVAGRGSLYIRQDNGGLYSNTGTILSTVWVLIGGGSSGGDVVGPSVSVDGQLAIYDGNSGKLIAQLDADTDGYVVTQVSGKPAWAPASGGGGNPGGDPGTVQYNDSGAFGGFGLWDGTSFDVIGNIGVDDEHAFFFNNSADPLWRVGLNLSDSFTTPKLAGDRLMIQIGSGTGEGFAIGNADDSYLQFDENKIAYFANSIVLPDNVDYYTTGLIRFGHAGVDGADSPQISNGAFAGGPKNMYFNGNAAGDTTWFFRDFNVPYLSFQGSNTYYGKFNGTHAYTVRLGAGKSIADSYPVGARLIRNIASEENVGTDPTDSHSYTLPAKAFAFNEDEIANIEFGGFFAGNDNGKNVEIDFDGTTLAVIDGTTETNGVAFVFKFSITRISATEFVAVGSLNYGEISDTFNVVGTVADWTSSRILKAILTSVADGDITCNKSSAQYFSQGS